MKLSRTGIILNTENYDACVEFYHQIFELNIIFQKQEGSFRLTCFDFNGAYLMVETGGYANSIGKSVKEGSMKLRFNVPDINDALASLQSKGIDAEIQESSWGSTINIYDPDGNRIGVRDEITFSQQASA
ncbi:VOC family protein [Endozoicomonas ascidiicola]|uniref:VOC family protein n=1 Tax=Endozoicomonas ascidiicola TaxID=1698521 RepID=UPI00083035EC|nr:VOC family protein [Endozoicomonas ascidiicola]